MFYGILTHNTRHLSLALKMMSYEMFEYFARQSCSEKVDNNQAELIAAALPYGSTLNCFNFNEQSDSLIV